MDPRKLLVPLLACVALAGCDVTIAPKRLDLTVTFDGGTAQLEYWLRDIQVPRGGLATSLPAFIGFAKPEMDDEADGLGPPQVYRWVVQDGGADLQVAWTIARDKFEACARDECNDFPVRRDAGTYALREDLDPKLMLHAEGTAMSWPADAGVLRYSGRLNDEVLKGEPVEDGESAAAVVALYLRSPEAAEATAKWMEAYEDAFTSGNVDEARKLIQARTADAGTSPELDAAIRETVLRQRQLLLWAYLERLGYKEALEEPLATWELRHKNAYVARLPQKPLAEPLGLKLRIAYEVARAGYIKRGQHADARAVLAEACGDKGARAKDAKRFCELLLVP